jgi:hypothetical protein
MAKLKIVLALILMAVVGYMSWYIGVWGFVTYTRIKTYKCNDTEPADVTVNEEMSQILWRAGFYQKFSDQSVTFSSAPLCGGDGLIYRELADGRFTVLDSSETIVIERSDVNSRALKILETGKRFDWSRSKNR